MWTGIWKACKSFINALFCSILSTLGVLLTCWFGCATAQRMALGCFEEGGDGPPQARHWRPTEIPAAPATAEGPCWMYYSKSAESK